MCRYAKKGECRMEQQKIIDINMLLEGIQRPGRYIGNEMNTVVKEHTPDMVSFAFVFPDLYEIGMSHLGLQILYHVLNQKNTVVCERVFAPALDMEEKLRSLGIPLFGLETTTPLPAFDCIGFSLQYELQYTNVLNILDISGIPVFASERTGDMPIIMAGGPCMVNPEPLAPFFDVIVIGDGEEVLPQILDVYAEIKKTVPLEKRKEVFFERIKDYDGVYLPHGQEKPVAKAIVRDLNTISFPDAPIVPYIRTVHARASIEIMRGCPRQCKFCQARYTYWPVRKRAPELVHQLARATIDNTGYNELSLQSLSVGDYPKIEELLEDLNQEFSGEYVSVAFPSLRVEKILNILAAHASLVRKTGLTFALEAGSQELRDAIGKDIDVTIAMQLLESIVQKKCDGVKLYFMIGLPGETMADIEQIIVLVEEMLAIARKANKKRFQINLGVSTFIPKPHTDFEGERLDTREMIKEKQNLLRDAFMHRRNVKLSVTDYAVSVLEAVLARGDKHAAQFIYAAWKQGARLDAWTEHFNQSAWEKARESFDVEPYIYQKRTDDDVSPWDFIECKPKGVV